jgi:hypothetical protein
VGGVHFELTPGAHSHDLSDSGYSWLDPQGVGFLGGGGAAADDGGWHLVSMLINFFSLSLIPKKNMLEDLSSASFLRFVKCLRGRLGPRAHRL